MIDLVLIYLVIGAAWNAECAFPHVAASRSANPTRYLVFVFVVLALLWPITVVTWLVLRPLGEGRR